MERDVLLAVLALDSYHRGYGPGLYLDNLSASDTEIGSLTIGAFEGDQEAENIGFFAQSYNLLDANGAIAERYISFRGTDNNVLNPLGTDQINGYGLAIGNPGGPQALLAGPFKDREVKVAVRDSSGRVTVDPLSSHVRQRSEPGGGTA